MTPWESVLRVRGLSGIVLRNFDSDTDSKSCDVNGLRKVQEYPPAQNQYMQEKILGDLIFA